MKHKLILKSFCALAALLLLFAVNGEAQTTIFQSGFETGDPAFIYSCTSCTGGLGNGTTNPNTGTNAGYINGGATKAYDGSIITGTTIAFTAGKYYTFKVFARVAVCTGRLQIMKSATATNAAMLAATGSNILLSSGSNNVTSTTYSLFSAAYYSSVTENKYVGFQLYSAGGGACGSLALYLDDISITEYDFPPCSFYCPQGGTTAGSRSVSGVTFDAISRTSSWDGYVCTGQAASVRRTLTYNLAVTSSVSASAYYSAAWIDWNGNGSFSDAGETVMTDALHPNVSGSSTRNISVTVPGGATLGTTKMRVKLRYNTSTVNNPCQTPIANDDVEDYDVNILPAPVPMVYSSTAVTQITSSVNAGSTRQEVLMVDVITAGQLSAPSATQFVFTTLGTTAIANITNARVYYTGSSNIFATTTQSGSTIPVPPADPSTMTFTASQVLSEGDNYFWIAYDVVATAPGGNVIDAKLVSVKVGATTYTLNSTPAGNRPIIASFPMTYISSTVVQNTNPVAINSTNNDVIRIEVVTSGAITPLTATDFTCRITGTTNSGDIQNAKLFYTADIPVFSTATQFGSTLAVPPASPTNFTVTGSATLVAGTNYFWLTYDVKPTAACNPAQIDALCNNILISAVNHVPSPSAPIGARTINCGAAYYSQCTCDFNNPVNWNTMRNGSGTALASTGAFATSTNSFYVQNGHTMTSSAALTMSNLYLEPGSYVLTNYLLTITTLYIQAFATFEQTYAQTNGTIAGTYIGSFYIKKDGTWKHNNNGWLPGTSGTQYFEPYSIQWFLGVGAGTFPGGTSWGTVILDIPSAPNLIINANSITDVHGDLVIRRWGGASNYFYINFDNPLYIDGDLIMSGGVSKGIAGFNCSPAGCNCNAAASGIAVNVAGDFIMSGGTWNDYNCGANSSTGMAMTIGGNVNITGGTINMNNNAGTTLHLVPITASTTWSQTGGSVTLGNTWVDAGKTVAMTGAKLGDMAAGRTMNVSTGGILNTSNYPVTGAGLFTLSTGATLGIGSANGITSSGASGNVQVTGTRSYNSGATYRYYEGLTPQATGNFSPTTTPTASTVANLIMDKNNPTDQVNLTNTINVTGIMTLTKGRLFTSTTTLIDPYIRIKAGAAVSPVGGSVNSYVDGFMRKEGTTGFVFPTGNNGRWRRIEIDVPSASTEFEGRYIYTPYTNIISMAAAPTPILDHVSLIEHWILNKPGAAASTKVTLYWEDAAASGIYKFDSLAVGRFNGAAWENTSSGLSSPGYTTSVAGRTYTGSATGSGAGTIRSNTVSSFSPFTFSSIGVYPLNPLPIELVAINATVIREGVIVTWTTATETNNDYFTVERSADAEHFEFVANVDGAGNSSQTRNYSTVDTNPLKGISYYRLRQTDFDGRSTTSDIIAVNISESGVISVLPNPAHAFINIIFSDASLTGNTVIEIFDSKGNIISSQTNNAAHGKNMYRINLDSYSKGIYAVKVTDEAGASSVKRFIVN